MVYMDVSTVLIPAISALATAGATVVVWVALNRSARRKRSDDEFKQIHIDQREQFQLLRDISEKMAQQGAQLAANTATLHGLKAELDRRSRPATANA